MSKLSQIFALTTMLVGLVSCSAGAHEFWFDDTPHGPHLPPKEHRARVDLDFQNTDAVYAMKRLAKQLGYNLLVSRSFRGTVNAVANDVPAELAFRLILSGELERFEVRECGGKHLLVGYPDEIDAILVDVGGPPEWARDEPVSVRLENMPPALLADFLQREFPDCKLSFESEGRVLHITGRNLQVVKFDAIIIDQHFYEYYFR